MYVRDFISNEFNVTIKKTYPDNYSVVFTDNKDIFFGLDPKKAEKFFVDLGYEEAKILCYVQTKNHCFATIEFCSEAEATDSFEKIVNLFKEKVKQLQDKE